jgi:predicted extracellular nuclease
MSALRRLTLAAVLAGTILPFSPPPVARALTAELFFSEYIEGSSNNKALEIHNGTGFAIDLASSAYNVQMFFNGSSTAGLTINLTGTVATGDVFVLAQASASAPILAQADQTNGAGWFNGDDAVVLRKGSTVIDVIGQIGLDPGAEWGTGLTSTADNTLRRKSTVCAGDINSGDAFDPSAEWDGFATDTFDGLGAHTASCGSEDAPPVVSATTPAAGAVGVALSSNITVTFSEPVGAAPGTFALSCTTSGPHTVAVSGGPATFVLDPDSDFTFDESCTVTVAADHVTDVDVIDPPDNMATDYMFAFTTEQAPIAIHDIQQAAHRSSLAGTVVTTTGIVTAKAGNGFYLQDPSPDATDATSEAIFVFTSSSPVVQVGDAVKVSGTVSEFRPGGASSTNLSSTEITGPTVVVQSSGNPLPPPTVLGIGGRMPPTDVIEDDASGSVETSGVFDPATDGIDFYESLEGMRLQVNNPIAVGPTNAFGEIFVVPDGGANASLRTPRGGVLVRPSDFNPERIALDDTVLSGGTPDVNVGDGFTTPAVGVLDYSFGNFKLNVTQPLTRDDNGLSPETTTPPSTGQLAVATFNVENLSPLDPPTKFAGLADEVVNHLLSPDVIALEEIQDNNGAVDATDPVVDADVTLDLLADAIVAAGGPAYEWRQINPVDDQDGGQPGGNIRVGFFFRTDRGVAFVDEPGGTPTSATSVVTVANEPHLSASPGRIDPANTAWLTSRKPLVGEFTYGGETVFVIANHFNSKGGDGPLFGRFQPPTRTSEVQRHQQAQVVNDFVDSILAVDGGANIVVLGDINDFDFSDTVSILKGNVLHNLMDTLPANERYSYVFEGNSQVLDQILVSDGLAVAAPAFDPVHINAEFFDQKSDHDPSVTTIDFANVWAFTGFLAPVDNGDVLNSVKAGQAVPIKFQLGGDRGLDIFAASPTSVRITCSGDTTVDPVEETVSAASSGLHYDSATSTYTYVWRTLKDWKGTCRRFELRLRDGTVRTADFQFT